MLLTANERAVEDNLTGSALTISERLSDHGGRHFVVRGETKPYAKVFAQLGGRWDRRADGWVFGETVAAPMLLALNEPERLVDLNAAGLAEDAAATYFGAAAQFDGYALSERLLGAGAGGLSDLELLQVLLFANVPASEARKLAGELLQRFGSLGAVLAAETGRLRECSKLDMFSIVLLKASQTLMERVLREKVAERQVISSISDLKDYLRVRLRHASVEQLLLLFLDAKNGLLADEATQKGTVNHTPLYPREVVKRALELGACSVIMVHNHPSGDPTPSRVDIDITKKVRIALQTVDVSLHEHLIVGHNRMVCLIGDGYL